MDQRPRLLKALPKHPDTSPLLEAAELFVQMPQSLCGLFPIVENLNLILPLVRELIPEVISECSLVERWCRLIASIRASAPIRHDEFFMRAYGGEDREGRPFVQPPLMGLYTDHPVWCVLWFSSGSRGREDRGQAYRLLQAHYLGSWMRLQRDERQLNVPQRLVEVGRLLRRLHQPEYGNELDRLAPVASQRDQLYDELVRFHENGDEGWAHYYGAFADVLNEAMQMGQPSVFEARTSHSGRRQVGRHSRDDPNRLYSNHAAYWRFLEPGSGMPDQDWGEVAVEEQQPEPEVAEFLSGQGVDPAELSSPDLVWVDLRQPDQNLGKLPPLGSLFAIARARARHLVMETQRFTTRRTRIRIGTLTVLIGVLDALYSQTDQKLSSVRSDASRPKVLVRLLETVQLLAVSLVTGTPPAEVVQLSCARRVSELPNDFRLAYAKTSRCGVWVRPYASPERRTLGQDAATGKRGTRPRVILSDVWSVARQLEAPRKGAWFSRTVEDYQEIFDSCIVPELTQNGVDARWLRFHTFGDIVPSWFQGREEGDHLRIAALFGRDDRLAHVQRYYTALDRQKLDRFYTTVMKDLWKRLKQNGFKPVSDLFKPGPAADFPPSSTGDDWVPRVESIQKLIVELRRKIQAPLERGDLARHVAWHNDVTVYTALGLAVITGFRAVRTPIPDLTAVDESTGLMCLQEKDRADGSHARIVWVPDMLREQVRQYLRYLQTLWRYLPSGWPTELVIPATKFRDRSQFDQTSYTLDLARTLFFIERSESGTYRPVELTGRTLQQHLGTLEQACWLVPNVGRHLLRSYLVQVGCPVTLINTHLGHWSFGEEPWGPYSAFDPQRYRQGIASSLNSLLDAIDYQLVEVKR